MADEDFCLWVLNAPTLVRNSVVCGVTWWRAKKSPLHHQFVVLTIKLGKTALYDLRVERIGKGIGLQGTAEHRITSTYGKRLEEYLEANELMFGMLGIEELRLVFEDRPDSFYVAPALVDQLDMKWRGPPATLWHVARYVQAVVKMAPRYKLSSTNCYYFARLIVYIIGLRHYAFATLVAASSQQLEVRNKIHDPSSISTMFRFLHEDEKSNGVLLYGKIDSLCSWLILIVPTAAVWGGAIYLWATHRRLLAFVVFISGGIFNFIFQLFTVNRIRAMLVESSCNVLRKDVEDLVTALGTNALFHGSCSPVSNRS